MAARRQAGKCWKAPSLYTHSSTIQPPLPTPRPLSDVGYDADDLTTRYLNLPEVKRALGARSEIEYLSCSPKVDEAMGHDVMKSAARLVPDLLKFSHLMLYQGQFDAECGFAGNDAWISKLAWCGAGGLRGRRTAVCQLRPAAGLPRAVLPLPLLAAGFACPARPPARHACMPCRLLPR